MKHMFLTLMMANTTTQHTQWASPFSKAVCHHPPPSSNSICFIPKLRLHCPHLIVCTVPVIRKSFISEDIWKQSSEQTRDRRPSCSRFALHLNQPPTCWASPPTCAPSAVHLAPNRPTAQMGKTKFKARKTPGPPDSSSLWYKDDSLRWSPNKLSVMLACYLPDIICSICWLTFTIRNLSL